MKRERSEIINGRHGSGPIADVEIGPLIDEKAVTKAEDHVADAIAKGGKVIIGGKQSELGGTFFEPTVVTDVRRYTKIAREGPAALSYGSPHSRRKPRSSNWPDTEYGLAAYSYARDLARVWRVAEALESGVVGVNKARSATRWHHSVDKQSGLEREGSKYGIEGYTEMKYVLLFCEGFPRFLYDAGIKSAGISF